ncbi:MAG: microcin C transport system permease protein [Verrucomicrobiales bacterium]|jgi:microcin C transport system permease protein
MTGYFIRRLLLIPPTLIGVTFLVFLITTKVPGGPIQQIEAQATMQSSNSGTGGATGGLTEAQIERLKEQFYLGDPLMIGYVKWLGDLCRGEFRVSFIHKQPVENVIAKRVGISLYYGFATLLIVYCISLPLGVFKAVRHNTFLDNSTSILVFMGYAIPGYVLGILLWFHLAAGAGWFPDTGHKSLNFDELSFFGKVGDLLHHSALPLLCYVIGQFAFVTFLMKNHLMENLAADYVRTAVAKGVPFRQAVRKHALRNSLIPIATNLGHQVGALLGGSFLIEKIFNISGIGLLFFESIEDRDFPVLMILVLITSTLMLIGNIVSDILVAIADPRVSFR